MTENDSGQFDALSIPLAGVHSIAASAGTGKTYTIATLFLRYLLETDCTVDQVLVTTYTEAATAELKDRLRTRLHEAQSILRRSATLEAARRAAEVNGAGETLVNLLAHAGAWHGASARIVRHRLEAAVLDFDHAPVFTIHGFCNRVLQELVFETGSRFDVKLVTSQEPLVEDAVADFVCRWWTAIDPAMAQWLPLDKGLSQLMRRAASLAVNNPGFDVVPNHDQLESLLESPLLGEFDRSVRTLADLWHEEGAQACQLLRDAREQGWLNKNKYDSAHSQTDQIQEAIDFVDRLVGDPSPETFDCDDAGKIKPFQRRLAQSEIVSGTKKAHVADAPRHEVFDRIDAVIAHLPRIGAHRQQTQGLMLARLTESVRAAVERRKQIEGIATFSDLLHDVDAALNGPSRALLLDGLRRRYRVALVDEFQDTDPVQMRIFRRAFEDAAATAKDSACRAFVMIGDPKQSIYRFRGADIHSYLAATQETPAANRHTMGTNWRSDGSLVDAVQAVFGSVPNPFEHPQISLPQVSAHHADRFTGGPALQITFVPRHPRLDADKTPGQDEALERVAFQVGADIVAQLGQRPKVSDVDGGERAVAPGDLAVLCRTGRQLRFMAEQLAQRGVPAVLQTDESVFETPEAATVGHVLRALLQPGDARALAGALLTPVFGLDADALLRLRQDEEQMSGWSRKFHAWHDLWRDRGFAAAWRRLLDEADTVPRLAGQMVGERRVTNYLHLGELLHRWAVTEHTGPEQLLRRLDRSMAEPARGRDDETQLRLETDAAAVQLCTIHKSKGLEYSIVYCPTLWHVFGGQSDPFVMARLDEKGRLLEIPEIDVGSERIRQRLKWNQDEVRAEERRLLYVALTRARHQCRIHWTGTKQAEHSALGRIILGSMEGEKTDADLEAQIRAWCDGPAKKAVELRSGQREQSESDPGSYRPEPDQKPRMQARPVARPATPGLVHTSFSALARVVETASADDAIDRDDASSTTADGPVSPPRMQEQTRPVALGLMPGGRKVGDLVHRIFEQVLGRGAVHDGDMDLVRNMVLKQIQTHMDRVQLDPVWEQPLATALMSCLSQPVAMNGSNCRLIAVPRAELACEMHFVLRAGHEKDPMDASRLAEVFASASPRAVSEYAGRARGLKRSRLRGFLEGFIDLVLRWEGRWYLLDYKTNRLGPQRGDYDPSQLASAMIDHDYVLQYHLYTVALDRMLRQRVADYDYDRHFGGAVYMFVRGFEPQVGPSRGIFFDRPQRRVIDELAAIVTAKEQP
jgi:exodeoxyribonuclease V beta subunit